MNTEPEPIITPVPAPTLPTSASEPAQATLTKETSQKPANRIVGRFTSQPDSSRGKNSGKAPIYTQERRFEILDSFTIGLAPYKAAQCAGISELTLKTWFKKEPKFAVECATARAKSEKSLVSSIRSVVTKDQPWQHNAWLLERGFGWVNRTELTGKDGGAVQVHSVNKQTLMLISGIGQEKIKGKVKSIES